MSVIRQLRPEETPDLLQLRRRLFIDEVVNSGIPIEHAYRHTKTWGKSPDTIARIDEYRSNTDSYHLRVVEHAGSLAGLLLVELHPEKYPGATKTRLIHLDAAIRGQGMGKRLMGDFFETYGNRENYLEVLEGNHSAIGFYEAQGFVPTGNTRDVKIDEYPTAFVEMLRTAPNQE
jgi:ribosomal protein S18 acetylase RimI-like enzyme